MSILSTPAQGSNSSSSTPALPQNPSSDHGSLLLPPSPSPQSPTTPPSLSLQFHGSSLPIASRVSGSMVQAAEDSTRSSKKMTDLGTPNGGKKTLSHQQYQFTGGHRIGPSQANVKMSGGSVSPQGQQPDGSISPQGSSAHSVGRKGQVTNGNHLLNFQYDPIVRSQPRARAPLPRRVQKRKPYNRDLFLQANYKFVVLDSGNYAPESLDPDKMLQWDDIICVRYSTPLPVQCPICLEYPLCPQITACGHIFCFPCILQYLLMGDEDHKGDCWKRCPLCFVMISPRDLYTLYLENVKQYHVSDTMEFMLLTRQKDSYIPSMKNKREDGTQCCNGSIYDSFSKFTFTSDVDLSVRKAISDLDGWLVRADSGLVDDLEKLPYVCAAMEHLEQRKKYWNEHRASDSNRPLEYADCLGGSHVPSPVANATTTCNNHGQGTMSSNNNIDDQSGRLGGLAINESDRRVSLDQASNVGGSFELQDAYSPGGETKNWDEYTNGFKDTKDKDSYNFYQAVDGQHMILHPLNMKCLLHHYGSYDNLPHRISGKILQLETVTQSEAMRRRYRYLSHFSLTTSFQLCEIDVNGILPSDALLPFVDEIKKREKQRKLLAKKERREKIKAEAVSSQPVPILSSFRHSSQDDFPAFSMDDFGALGTATETSSSPPIVGERKLFSRVTKLGFAAAHDSPALKIEEDSSLQSSGVTTDSSSVAGSSRSASTMSFANVISKGKSVDNSNTPKLNENGKKGKKPSRVLLSTAGGRRY